MHVLEAVRSLPDDRREALIMRFALGMDNREIARALGSHGGSDEGADPSRDQAARGGGRSKEQDGVVTMSTPRHGKRLRAVEIVRLLEAALAPVEPPARLGDELEVRLAEVTGALRRSRSSPTGSSAPCATRATGCARRPRSRSAPPRARRCARLHAPRARASAAAGLRGIADQGGASCATPSRTPARGLIR